MSYVRWGTIIDAELTDREWIDMYMDHTMDFQDRLDWCKQHKNPDCYLSDWYIFWHSMGGDESEKREDQYLSMWNCNEERTPTLDYMTVKQMLETDDWSPLGYETITQKEVLVDCVKRWLSNVEDEQIQ